MSVFDSRKRNRGGRRATGRPPMANPAKFGIRVNKQVKEMLDSERLAYETYSETLQRILRSRTERIADLQKKVDALSRELEQIRDERRMLKNQEVIIRI